MQYFASNIIARISDVTGSLVIYQISANRNFEVLVKNKTINHCEYASNSPYLTCKYIITYHELVA